MDASDGTVDTLVEAVERHLRRAYLNRRDRYTSWWSLL